jgi:hypothetical protein
MRDIVGGRLKVFLFDMASKMIEINLEINRNAKPTA